MLNRPGRLRRAAVAAGTAVVLVVLAFGAGVYADQNWPEALPLLRLHPQSRQSLDQQTVDQTLRLIQAHYLDSKLDYRRLTGGSVRGMVQALDDPYSEYLDPQEFHNRQDFYAGRHNGMVGVYVNFRQDYPMITGILPNSPAQRAGLQSEDEILRIGDTDARGLKTEQASALIRGPVGTSVTLHVRRDGQERDVTVERADFRSPSVQSFFVGDGVLYLRIYQFGSATLSEFDEQLNRALPSARSIILDLRDNGGGFIDAATGVIGRFVADGEAYEERGRGPDLRHVYVGGPHPATDRQLLVLVNGGSASASEIVAGALQARGRAKLVGTKTFGKGSVQIDYQLPDGGDLHLTVDRWLLPGGRSIDRQGLAPDVVVELPDRAAMFDVVQPSRGHAADSQLNRALQLLGAS